MKYKIRVCIWRVNLFVYDDEYTVHVSEDNSQKHYRIIIYFLNLGRQQRLYFKPLPHIHF
jgi:hypothetical protein